MAPQPDWLNDAFDIYREAWFELERWKSTGRADVEYYLEELKEALLDLKQAVIDQDPARSLQYIEEVMLLLAELRLRWQDD